MTKPFPYRESKSPGSPGSSLRNLGSESFEPTRSAREGIQAEIELVVHKIAIANPGVRERILKDLYLAAHGTKEQIAAAKKSLANKIPDSLSPEIMDVIRARCEEVGSMAIEPVSKKSQRAREEFDRLFPS